MVHYRQTLLGLVTRTVLISAMLVGGVISIADIIQNFSQQWYWLIVATFYTVILNDVFTHRICGHNMFKVNVDLWLYKFLTYMSSVDQGFGPVRPCALGHLAHHIHSDQGCADPLNVKLFWLGVATGMPFRGWGFTTADIPNPQEYVERAYQKHQDIVDDPWSMFCEKYSLVISIVTLSLFYFLLPVFLFKVILVGRVIMVLLMTGAGICHVKNFPASYRNVDTHDESTNNLFLHYLFLGIFGGMLQNNHHSHPNSLNQGSKWYEIDVCTPVAYAFKFLMEKK